MSNIDLSKLVTAEQKEQRAAEAEVIAVEHSRKQAYAAEADPLLFDFLAEKFRDDPAAKAWLTVRGGIKAKYPKPQSIGGSAPREGRLR